MAPCRAQRKICSPKTNYDTNNHLPSPTKNYIVQKQTTKQIITCRAQQKKYVVQKQTTKQIITYRTPQKTM